MGYDDENKQLSLPFHHAFIYFIPIMSVIMLIIIQTKEKMKTSYRCSTHSLCFTTPMLPLPLYPMLYHILMLPLPP